jgi:hypothetical protein
VPEKPQVWDDGLDVDRLLPVTRLRFDNPGPEGAVVPVVRYFPTDTYPEARAALLAHYDVRCRWTVEETPGYFVTAGPPALDAEEATLVAEEAQMEVEAAS